jgi:hypothetical protein
MGCKKLIMIELKFDKKLGEITLPINEIYLKLAQAVDVTPQILPNLAFAFLDILKNEPDAKIIIDKIKQGLIKPIPQESLTKI